MFQPTSSRTHVGPPQHRQHSHHSHSSSSSRRHSTPHAHAHSHSHSHSPAVSHSYSHTGSQRPTPDFPITNDELWRVFNEVDLDRNGSITVYELQKALKNGDWQPFDLDTILMLMNMFDKDRSGTITFNEFAGLFKYIFEWQQVFKHFDRDHSRTIDSNELVAALRSFNFNLTPACYELVRKKYTALPQSEYSAVSPGITFDRFVRACVHLKSLTDTFYKTDRDRDGWVTVSYEQFMQMYFQTP